LASDLVIPVTLLVVTKAPVPGLAKTRLAEAIGGDAAADIAAAALLDTLDAVAATPVRKRVVALTGDLELAKRSNELRSTLAAFTVIEQRGADFAERLANACADTAAATGAGPILLIASDTPQVTADLLADCAQTLAHNEAVFGLACDGGWWLFGMADCAVADVLRTVPTSRSDTGAVTLAALRDTGIDVKLVTELADVDTVDDMEAVRRMCPPGSRFAQAAGG
jgi:rSAM/selenodomain-associated transferase 1